MSTEKLNAEKTKALENAMRQIEKDFGKGSIMKLGEASAKMNIGSSRSMVRNLPVKLQLPCI